MLNNVPVGQKKGTWDPENMRKAMKKVLNNEMSARQAAGTTNYIE